MIERIQNLLERVDTNEVWLVAVSGGRDSVVLLELLVRLGFRRLVLVHVNHQLRRAESDEDAVFVESLAKRCGIPFYSEAVDVAAMMRLEAKGLELAAREARHGVFGRALQQHAAAGVMLGHHADDQAETVLYNLLRGSGGLKGIRYENTIEVDGVAVRLLRPLLEFRRGEIDAYVESYGIEYREDASNMVGVTARNRIRHEVMPLMAEIMQRDVVEQINAAAEVSRQEADCIREGVDLESLLDPQGRLYMPGLLELHPAAQRYVIIAYLKKHRVPNITRGLVSRCMDLRDPQGAAKCNLPGGRWMRRKEQRLFIDC